MIVWLCGNLVCGIWLSFTVCLLFDWLIMDWATLCACLVEIVVIQIWLSKAKQCSIWLSKANFSEAPLLLLLLNSAYHSIWGENNVTWTDSMLVVEKWVSGLFCKNIFLCFVCFCCVRWIVFFLWLSVGFCWGKRTQWKCVTYLKFILFRLCLV